MSEIFPKIVEIPVINISGSFYLMTIVADVTAKALK
jgi:hypothetical protein